MTPVIEDLEPVLLAHPFFDGLPRDLVSFLTSCARNVRFDAGETIFRQGDPADHFYLLRAGRVALETHDPARGPLVVHTLEAGEVLGWSWLFAPYRCYWTARAVERSRALAMDAQCLRSKFEAKPELGYAMMLRVGRVLSDRLHSARLQMLDVFHNGKS